MVEKSERNVGRGGPSGVPGLERSGNGRDSTREMDPPRTQTLEKLFRTGVATKSIGLEGIRRRGDLGCWGEVPRPTSRRGSGRGGGDTDVLGLELGRLLGTTGPPSQDSQVRRREK